MTSGDGPGTTVEPGVLGGLVVAVGVAVASLVGFRISDCNVCTYEEVYALLTGGAVAGLGAVLRQARSPAPPWRRVAVVLGTAVGVVVLGWCLRTLGATLLVPR